MSASEQLLVVLRASTSDFDRKFKESEARVTSFGTKSSGGLQKFAALGGTALKVAGVATAAIGFIAVKAADDFEKSHALLVNALTRSGQSFKTNEAAVSSSNRAMEKLGYTNAESEKSLARLVTGTGNVAKSQRDQAVAADVAAARGLDLTAATDLLVKVESGRYTALGRLGIATKDQVKGFKSTAEAVAFLADKYKGAAAAAADTFGGKMKVLGATVTNVAKDIGLELIPVIEGLASGLGGVVHFFEDNQAAAIALGVAVGAVLVPAMVAFVGLKVAAVFSTLATNIGAGIDFAYGLAAGMVALASGEEAAAIAAGEFAAASTAAAAGVAAGPFVIAAAAIAAIAGAGYLAADALGLFDDTIKRVDTDAKHLAVTSVAQLTAALKTQNDSIQVGAARVGTGYVKAITAASTANQKASTAGAEFNKVFKDSPQFAQKFIDAMARAGLNTDAARAALARHTKGLQGNAKNSAQAELATQKFEDKVDGGTRVLDAAAKAADQAAKATKTYADATFSAFDAADTLANAQQTLADDIGKGSVSLQQVAKDIRDVTQAAGEKAAQDLGPSASASAQTVAATSAQIFTLAALKNQYPQMAGPIDAYIAKLQQNIDASKTGNATQSETIAVLEGLRGKYDGIGPSIDAIEAKVRAESGAQRDANASGATAIAVLEGLRARYGDLGGAINTVEGAIRGLPSVKNIDINVVTHFIRDGNGDVSGINVGGGRILRAMGGPIPGSGPVPITAHGGEYVLSKDVVDRIKSGRASQGAQVGATTTGSSRGGDNYYTLNLSAVDARGMKTMVLEALTDHVRTEGNGQLKRLIGAN